MSKQFTKRSDLPAAERAVFRERLLKLAGYLRKLPKGRYNHSNFITSMNPCGTVACAFGHAVDSKLFPDIGLFPDINHSSGHWELVSLDAKEGWRTENYADYFGPRAYADAFSTYAYGHHVTRNMVIKRLEVLADHRFAP